ncbi:hypothetical protein [Pedococcus ginsenosidimutans]
MTTTNTHFQPAALADEVVGQGVSSLGAFKRRKRLHALEATRSHLASMAAQQRSHGLEDAEESFSLQLIVEAAIRDEFSAEFEELFPGWLENDNELEHPTGTLTAGCGICRSIAAATRINLDPPEAA